MSSLNVTINDVEAIDIRFPTSLQMDGTDAIHVDPNYSAVYVIISTQEGAKGYGLTFTIGRGNEIVKAAVNALKYKVMNKSLRNIVDSFGLFWHELTNESQLRWIGPEKGVIHLATAAIVNALWDLWARLENKPVWKLLVDMEPEKIVSLIDFTYIDDFLSKSEALDILNRGQEEKSAREADMIQNGFPAYTTAAGWMGYSDEKIQKLCRENLETGMCNFKIKIGVNLEDDRRRMQIFRDIIGYDKLLMTDANQKWSVDEAKEWMEALSSFLPYWIEEPTSPDDILGHAEISRALKPLNIRVATGEMCQNRVMFKQFLKSGGMQVCQIDACRMGGVNEVLAVILMAAKAGVPVCPHAGGVGLCELVQHFIFFDYVCVSKTLQERMCEYVDHLHEHFVFPVNVRNGRYYPPKDPGYSAEMKAQSINDYKFPDGPVWTSLLNPRS